MPNSVPKFNAVYGTRPNASAILMRFISPRTLNIDFKVEFMSYPRATWTQFIRSSFELAVIDK